MGSPSGFILAFGLLTAGSREQDLGLQSQYYNAAGQAAEAAYTQSGLRSMIDKGLQDLERKYVPKEVEKYGSPVAIAVKACVERRLVWTYSF